MTSEQTVMDGLGEHAPVMTKTCPRCHETKPVSAFGRDRNRSDGIRFYCRECVNAYRKDYYHKHKGEAAETPRTTPIPTIGGTVASRTEEDRRLTELALRTRNWALRIGAYVSDDTGHHGYFTVQEWMDEMGQTRRVWTRVLAKMYRLGFPVAQDDFVREGSHYLGTPRDQAKKVTSMFARAFTYIETGLALLQAIQESGNSDPVMDAMRERLANNRHEMTFDRLARLGDSIGVKLTPGLEQLLLDRPPAETR